MDRTSYRASYNCFSLLRHVYSFFTVSEITLHPNGQSSKSNRVGKSPFVRDTIMSFSKSLPAFEDVY
jgi:hypothetical protein